MSRSRDHLVIGLGSGRCGTRSLSKVLGVSHEAYPLPWEMDDRLFHIAMEQVSKTKGDVGLYWLNYVDKVLRERPDTKFICLRRNKADTVKSWVKRLVGSDRFGILVLYLGPDREILGPPMTQRYRGIPMNEASSLYWDDYYRVAEHWQSKFPKSFRIFKMERVLNDRSEQRKMLQFARMRRKPLLGCHEKSLPANGLELGNALRDCIEDILEKNKLFYGMKVVIKPKEDSALGKLAVESGLSTEVTDDITMDFSELMNKAIRD